MLNCLLTMCLFNQKFSGFIDANKSRILVIERAKKDMRKKRELYVRAQKVFKACQNFIEFEKTN